MSEWRAKMVVMCQSRVTLHENGPFALLVEVRLLVVACAEFVGGFHHDEQAWGGR